MRRSIGRNRVFAGQGRALAALPAPFGSVAGGLPSRSADDKPTGSAFKGVLDWTRNASQRRGHFQTSSFLLQKRVCLLSGSAIVRWANSRCSPIREPEDLSLQSQESIRGIVQRVPLLRSLEALFQ